jgi:hypothetical protein
VTIREAVEVVTKSCGRQALDVSDVDVARAFEVGTSNRWHRISLQRNVASRLSGHSPVSREDGAKLISTHVTYAVILAQKVMSDFERS